MGFLTNLEYAVFPDVETTGTGTFEETIDI
jgi:hypothetical protein